MNSVANGLELSCLGGREAHVADYDGGEGTHDAVWNSGCYDGNKQYNGFGISGGYQELLLLERLILDAGFIAGHSLDCDYALSVAEKPGVGRRIWKEKVNDC